MNTPNRIGFKAFSGRTQWKFLFIMVGIALVGGFVALKASSQVEQQAERQLVVSSQSIEVLPGYYVDRYFSAQVQSRQSVALASEVAGKVTNIYVDDGDRVAKGEAIFELDIQLLEQQKLNLLAQQDTVRADKVLARKRLKRQQNLNQNSFSSEDTIDALESQITRLNATLKSIQAQSQDIEIRIRKSTIYAPFNGQIQKRHIDIGAVINAGTIAFDLIDNQQLEIQVGLPLAAVNQIEIDKNYVFMQNNRAVMARAIAVLPKIDPVTQTQGVKFSVDEMSDLIPGDFVKLKMSSYQASKGFWLANSALVEGERGLWQIFVIDEEGRVNKQSVTITYPGNPNSFVVANIQSGKKVVTKGVHRLANRVAVIEQEVSNTDEKVTGGSESSEQLSIGVSQ